MAAPKASTPAPKVEQKKGGIVRGAAVGAVGGKVLGSSSKTTKRSAAAGALVGGARQGSANNRQEQQRTEGGRKKPMTMLPIGASTTAPMLPVLKGVGIL